MALSGLKSGLWWVGGLWSWVGWWPRLVDGLRGGLAAGGLAGRKWADGSERGWLALTWVGKWAGGLGGDGLVYWCPCGWDVEH